MTALALSHIYDLIPTRRACLTFVIWAGDSGGLCNLPPTHYANVRTHPHRPSARPSSGPSSVALALGIQTAYAEGTSAAQLDSVNVTVQSGAYGSAAKGTASAIAPTQASLDATQPQSIITREFIDLSVAPTTEYSRIVSIAPSVSGEAANGPGLGETKVSLRGFSDDQYNITFDGIPWGDTNNPAHHSTSFFPGTIIGGATVERGPGNASNLGYATFGGSINLFSKKPAKESSASIFATIGNWNTRLLGAACESGRMAGSGEVAQLRSC